MQNSSDNLPSYLQTNIIAQMLSTGGEGMHSVKDRKHLRSSSVLLNSDSSATNGFIKQ